MQIFMMLFILLLPLNSNVFAKENAANSYFRTLKSDEVNVRTGPGLRYPIAWVYKRQYLPVKIVERFEYWRKIEDFEGEEGWVHKSLLSGKRYGMANRQQIVKIYRKPNASSSVVAQIERHVIVMLSECNARWCKIHHGDIKGWMQKKKLWGVKSKETF